eukprot:7006751-Pyramimonas_sp.AAC.2
MTSSTVGHATVLYWQLGHQEGAKPSSETPGSRQAMPQGQASGRPSTSSAEKCARWSTAALACRKTGPSSGHSSPGIKCPESRVTDLIEAGAPRYFIHGTQWRHIPSILNVGLSCRSEDNPKGGSTRQMVQGCPYVPGDKHIQSGLRVDAEVLILVSLKNLIRDGIQVWRSANDIIMTSGVQGRIL